MQFCLADREVDMQGIDREVDKQDMKTNKKRIGEYFEYKSKQAGHESQWTKNWGMF